MNDRIASFEKVSYDEFKKAFNNDVCDIYDSIKLPQRATKGSAGYDFFAPYDILLKKGETIKIPTGIRVKMNEDYVLFLLPRSSLGFKYRLQLDNTVGVIDSDYYYSDNEGHIFIKLTNDSKIDKDMIVKKGEGICQGIFLKFGITMDDDTNEIRNGGFGSTNKR